MIGGVARSCLEHGNETTHENVNYDREMQLLWTLVAVLAFHLSSGTLQSSLTGHCGSRSNSSEEQNVTSLCPWSVNLCNYFWKDVASLQTDGVSYVGGQSVITATVNPNSTEDNTTLYYRLCYFLFHDFTNWTRGLIGCDSNGTYLQTTYNWSNSGKAILAMRIYTNDSYSMDSFFACATTNVTIAANTGVDLSVEVEDDYSGDHWGPDLPNTKHTYLTGNLTFVPTVDVTTGERPTSVYYVYDFGDGGPVVKTNATNVTHCYWEEGNYTYTVDAIASVNSFKAYHGVYSSYLFLQNRVENVSIVVNDNNQVKVGSRANVTISAGGSLPITICWHIQLVNASVPVLINGSRPLRPIRTCDHLNTSSSTTVNMTFNQTGQFEFVADFENEVSRKSGRFEFSVVSTPTPSPPAVVASSVSAAVIALIVLIAVVVIIIALVAGGYIPYRRYRNRLTETADFRFVDLSDRPKSRWNSLKLRARQLKEQLQRPKGNGVRLESFSSLPPSSNQRRRVYGSVSDTYTVCDPYD